MTATTDHYTIISADCHAGGNHEMYREYLDPKYRDDFDAWRNKYKNPFRDLQDGGRVRNWDDDRRMSDLYADKQVAEVIYPNTVPPFFPSFVLFAKPPTAEQYELRRAGLQAHNRWLADFCSRFPEQRAGIGQVFLNDVDDAIEDLRWIAEHGLRGGVLISSPPPDCKYVPPLYDPALDPFWRECEALGVPVNAHGGTGLPDYGRFPSSALLFITEVSFYSQRPFSHMLLSGVFERFPNLKFVMAEMGCAWIPPMLERYDSLLDQIRRTGRTGELAYGPESVLPKSATEYFNQNCWVAVSPPQTLDVEAIGAVGLDRVMWGSDYPHDEGTGPFTMEHLQQVWHDIDPTVLRKVLAGNAADLYGFDLDALAPLAEQYGPTVAEVATPLERLPENANEALLRNV